MRLTSHKANRAKHIDLQMTSMIDVVFLLLIFFLVTTSIVDDEQQLVAGIRQFQQNASQRNTDLEPAVVYVALADNQVVYRMGTFQTSNFAELKPRLMAFSNKESGAFVRAEGNVPFSAPALVLAECRRAGFAMVTLVPDEESN